MAKKPETLSLAKVKGEQLWLAKEDTGFCISPDKSKATLFNASYLKEIIQSRWGGKEWEKDKPDA